MKKVTLKRVIKSGYVSFRRNGWLSMATVLVMVLVLFVLGGLVFFGAFAGTVLNSLESKIDISVYFRSDADEEHILAVQQELERLPDVALVSYVSREDALGEFRERHKDNALIVGALEELGTNPLVASLNIRATNPSNYARVSEFLVRQNYPIVEKINYFENQQVIERLGAIIGTVRGSGALVALFLAFVAVLVAFNTIRLAIYTLREEIGIMRLVGASSWFIRGPFLVTGLLYGGLATVAVMMIFFPLAWLAAPKVAFLVPEFDLFQYFLSNFWELLAILLGAGLVLGVASSLIAVRRYLTV